jgi:hypothetical protein
MKIVLTPEERKKKIKGICIFQGCNKPHYPFRNYCSMHVKQLLKKKNPTAYQLAYQKQNQKRAFKTKSKTK